MSVLYLLKFHQTNKTKLIEKSQNWYAIKLEGISEIRDESDKDGMRIAIDLRQGENAEVIVNNLFIQTPLESSFSINMVALDEGQPKIMTLRDLIAALCVTAKSCHSPYYLWAQKAQAWSSARRTNGAMPTLIVLLTLSRHRQTAKKPAITYLTNTWQSGGVIAMLEAKQAVIRFAPMWLKAKT